MATISELLERNTTDPRARLEVGQELLAAFDRTRLPSDSTIITNFCDLIVQWLNGSNFKVGLLALEIVDAALEVSGDVLAPYMLENVTVLMERLGDSKEQVRQTALDVILKLMRVPHSSPQIIFERMLGGFTHKQQLVRIGVMQVLQHTLRTFGGGSLQLSKVVPLICKLILDPNSQVRDTAADTLVEIYIFTGDRFVADLQRRRLIPDQKLSAILQRFQDAKRAGLVGPDGEPAVDVSDQHPVAAMSARTPQRRLPPPASASARVRTSSRASNMSEADEEQENVNTSASGSTKGGWSRASSVPAHKRVNVTARYSGSAGAVSEEQFEKAFTDVPKLDIFSGKELLIHTQQIRDVLSDPNNDWNKRVDSLKKLRSLLIGGASNFPEFTSELKVLEVPLQLAAKDLRSQVVREACITIAFYTERLELKLERLVEAIFHVLINLIQNCAKVMATSGLVACRYIIQNVRTPKLVPIVTSYMNSKSREIRKTCCDFVAMILANWEPHTVERNIPILVDAIKQGLNDADPDARAASRKAYHALADNFKEHAEMLFQSLDAAKQRTLAGEMSQSSSSQSIGGVRRSQENLAARGGSSGYGMQRGAYYGGRSTSDIDTGAARRALQRHAPPPSARVKPPLQPMNALQRPQRLSVATTAATPRTSAFRAVDATTPGQSSARTPSKSISQPGSRSGSPTSRLPMSVRKPRVSVSGRSTQGSREQSPTRTPYARRLSTENSRNVTPNREMERALLDALKVRGNGGGYLDDFDDTSSQCSERSLGRFESVELTEAIRLCQSTQWTDKKEGLTAMQSIFRAGKPLSNSELKRLCDSFARMFVEQHNKTFSLFLDTLVDFLAGYRSDLCDWLYVLLTRLLTKSGNELLPSVFTKVQKTLDVVRESFPYDLQFHTLCRYIQDPLHTPSLKVKVALLEYLHDLLLRMDSGAFTNTAEVRQAVSKVILWVNEPKSAEVRRVSQEVLVAMFSLNASEFTSILATFPKPSQDTVYALLKSNVQRQNMGGGNVSRPQPPSSGAYGGTTLDMGQVHDRLRETSAQINQYVFGGGEVEKGKGGSQDSGIVDAADGFARGDDNTRLNLMDAFQLTADEDRQEEIIADICQELSNHNRRSHERCKSMATLKHMARDGSFTLWDEHFKTILLLLIETLGDSDFEIRSQALRVLKEICLSQATRFRDYAELTVMRVLEAHKDGEKEVVRSAEECAGVLATHLPPHVCLRVLNPVISNEGMPKLLAAIKMITKVIEQLSPDEIERILPDVVPGVVAAFESQDSSVRKASCLCLVALHNSIGEPPLQPFLTSLNSSKVKLLHLYIKRAQTSSGHI